tara:strand:+ start:36 stop:329 length:294 start_codon:yes stop_codon:yes gene_type:complete
LSCYKSKYGSNDWLRGSSRLKLEKKTLPSYRENYTQYRGATMKTYKLKIIYNPDTDDIESIEEYVEDDTPVFEVGDMMFEVPEELRKYLESDILGLA